MPKVKKSHEDKIREKVYSLISPLIPDVDLKENDEGVSVFDETILSDEAMNIWKRAFVHKSISTVNYDVLEKIGDKIASTVFLQWLHKMYPDENSPQFFSEANSMYCSKDYFYNFAEEWNLVPIAEEILPEGIEITDKEKSDLFESFIGATLNIIDDYYVEGLGYLVVYKLITPLFETLNIDPAKRESYVTKRTILKDWFDEKYGSDDKYLVKRGNNMIRPKPIYDQKQERLTDVISGKFTNFFVSTVRYPSSIKGGKVIAVGDRKRRIADAQEDAAAKAVEKLKVTYDRINRLKEKKYQKDYGETIKYLAEQGIDAKFDVIQAGETGNNNIILIMKVKDPNTDEYVTVDTKRGLKRAQLRSYISKMQNTYLESKGLLVRDGDNEEINEEDERGERNTRMKPKPKYSGGRTREQPSAPADLARKVVAKAAAERRFNTYSRQRGTSFKTMQD